MKESCPCAQDSCPSLRAPCLWKSIVESGVAQESSNKNKSNQSYHRDSEQKPREKPGEQVFMKGSCPCAQDPEKRAGFCPCAQDSYPSLKAPCIWKSMVESEVARKLRKKPVEPVLPPGFRAKALRKTSRTSLYEGILPLRTGFLSISQSTIFGNPV